MISLGLSNSGIGRNSQPPVEVWMRLDRPLRGALTVRFGQMAYAIRRLTRPQLSMCRLLMNWA
jgi:hypothetical protein